MLHLMIHIEKCINYKYKAWRLHKVNVLFTSIHYNGPKLSDNLKDFMLVTIMSSVSKVFSTQLKVY